VNPSDSLRLERHIAGVALDGNNAINDIHAADHPAEFFAVMSEAFFATPDALSTEYPAVYEQLRRFYQQDPLRKK
jgi:Mlc titration factor MtfA (ptsG expression regulator)